MSLEDFNEKFGTDWSAQSLAEAGVKNADKVSLSQGDSTNVDDGAKNTNAPDKNAPDPTDKSKNANEANSAGSQHAEGDEATDVMIHSRYVNNLGKWAAHTYITVPDGKGGSITIESTKGDKSDRNHMGFIPNKLDIRATTDADRDARTSSATVAVPEGMTKADFAASIMDAAQAHTENALYGTVSANCNETTRTLLESAGSSVPEGYDPPGASPGLHPGFFNKIIGDH